MNSAIDRFFSLVQTLIQPITRWYASYPQRRDLSRWVMWFSLLNLICLYPLMHRYLAYAGTIDPGVRIGYVPMMIFGHVFTLTLLAALILLLPIAVFYPRRWAVFSAGVITATLAGILLEIDYGIYGQYRFHINAVVIDFLVHGGDEVIHLSWATWINAIGRSLGLLAVEIAIAYISWRIVSFARLGKVIFLFIGIGVVSTAGSHLVHAWADGSYYQPITRLTRHLPIYYPLTAKRFLEKHGLVDLEKKIAQRKMEKMSRNDRHISYPAAPLSFSRTGDPMNIVYVVIDSWRFDMMDAAITPKMTHFMANHPVQTFTNHLSGGNGTRTGIFSLFYGMFGSNWTFMETEQVGPVFMHTLIDQGYQMGIFASAKLTSPAFNQTVFHDIGQLRTYSTGDTAWERDEACVRDWATWFGERDEKKPFFTFLFFDSAHAYTFPPNYPRQFTPLWERVDYHLLDNDFDPIPYKNRYKTSLNYIDSLVSRVLETLENASVLDRTLIVFTSDHGQEFNENKNNYWGHGSNFSQYQIHVPFVIYWPGKSGHVYRHASSHFDIVPTLMADLLHCDNPFTDYSNGRNLFDDRERPWLFSGGVTSQAILNGDKTIVMYPTGNYDIFDSACHELSNARLPMTIVQAAFAEMTRFSK